MAGSFIEEIIPQSGGFIEGYATINRTAQQSIFKMQWES